MICKWTDDSQRFILEYIETISYSPSEIYHSALPFSPSSSWLRECYSPELLQRVKVVKGLQANWGVCYRTVSLGSCTWALACWKDLVAVSGHHGDVDIIDAITGICTSTFSSHTELVCALAFSLGGAFLVSGSNDKTVIIWDIQTGGVIKTFHGHTKRVLSVSISPDCTTIASGSSDHTIRLWDGQSGECHCVIYGHNDSVHSVGFSPTNSQLLISASEDGTVKQWDINGHQIGSTYEGDCVVFSPDGTCFVSWKWDGKIATILDFNSREVVAEIQLPDSHLLCCCFSPDGKFVAGGIKHTIYIWDITGFTPYLVETLTGHNNDICSIVFSSSLISSSIDQSVKFWQTSTSLVDSVITYSESIQFASVKIMSVSLQATNGIAISSDFAGVVKTWDILTGLCKASFQTPAIGYSCRDAQLIGGRLIFVWLENQNRKVYIWDLEKGESLQILDIQFTYWPKDFRISADGSKVFLLYRECIQALSIWTGQVVGEVVLEDTPLNDSLIVDNSSVWVYLWNLQTKGWDFGHPGSVPVPLSSSPLDRPHLQFFGTRKQYVGPSRIEDMVTRKVVFRPPEKFANPRVARLDDQYLVAGYKSGDVLILDLNHVVP